MSEFKNGDKLLHEKYGEVTFVGLDPSGRGFACFDVGTCLGYVNLRLSDVKPKPKTITVEIPKPKVCESKGPGSAVVMIYFDSTLEANEAVKALNDISPCDPQP